MNIAPDNPFGWTHYGGVDDQLTLKKQLRSAKIPFTEIELNMAETGAANAHVVTYHSPTKNKNVVVLVVPRSKEAWCSEEYYYFMGLDARAVPNMDWYSLLDQMQTLMWDDMKKRAQHPMTCPVCGSLNIWVQNTFQREAGAHRCPKCDNPR